MKIINAFWEKRNLGVDCIEVNLEQSDSIKDVQDVIIKHEKIEYQVFKIPTGNINFVKELSEKGFCFIETIFEVKLDIDKYSIPENIERFNKKITYKPISKNDLVKLEVEINKGIFNTDRVALDPEFGIDYASRRYFNWIKDENEKCNCMFEILYNDKPLGFFGLKEIGVNSYDNFLAGLYINDNSMGLGFSILSKSIEETKNRMGKHLTTHISSNNLPVIRIYTQFGFIPTNISYIMVKHV
jgi:hypothetical protein